MIYTMKKTGFLFLILVCVLFVGCKRKGASDGIRVGAAIALTGFGADFGQSEKNAIEFLKEKYGDEGDVKFYIEDTQSDVKAGLNAIKKLVNVHKCDIIYCELSSIVNAASAFVNKKEVTLIAPVYLQNLKENPFAIRNLPSADQENSDLIGFLDDNDIAHEKFAVLYSNDVFGQTCFDSFKSLLPDGSVICYSGAINEDALRQTALKAIGANPDVIYLGSMSETLGLLVKHLRENGYQKEIVTTDAFSYDYIYSLAGEYAKGVRYVDFQDSDDYKGFRDKYYQRFGVKCAPTAMLCYDGISAVISAIIEGTEMNGFTYDGLTGKIVIKENEIIYPTQVLTWE